MIQVLIMRIAIRVCDAEAILLRSMLIHFVSVCNISQARVNVGQGLLYLTEWHMDGCWPRGKCEFHLAASHAKGIIH
jgi:uncharacterized membrane protein